MAWYRAGGAGIPSSLKSGMNDVLNKKFGTSTTYPPSDWPSDVNLLGPLPEKTASGAIANFTDGADTVPLKSLVFGIEPVQASGTPSPTNPLPISGHTSLNGVHTGENMIPALADGTYEGNGVKAVVVNGVATLSGTTNASGNAFSIPFSENVKTPTQLTYLHLCNSVSNGSVAPLFEDSSDVGNTSLSYSLTPVNRIVEIPSNRRGVKWDRVRFYLGANVTLSGTFSPMICATSTATTYAPYSAESKKWEFPQTVYSGQVNALTGETESDAKLFDMGSLTWYADSNRTGLFYTGLISNASYTGCAIMCEEFLVNNAKNPNTISDNEMSSINSYGSNSIFIKNTAWDGYTGAQVATAVSGIKVLIKLATPTEITLDSVNWQSKYADNNFYNDCGDTSVTYRQDIELALGGN